MTEKIGFTEFVETAPIQTRGTWIRSIPEYETIVKLYDMGQGTYTDMEGRTQPITYHIIYLWLLARGYSPEVCRERKIKYWCEEARKVRTG